MIADRRIVFMIYLRSRHAVGREQEHRAGVASVSTEICQAGRNHKPANPSRRPRSTRLPRSPSCAAPLAVGTSGWRTGPAGPTWDARTGRARPASPAAPAVSAATAAPHERKRYLTRTLLGLEERNAFSDSACRSLDPRSGHSRIGCSTCMGPPTDGFAPDRVHRPGTFHPDNAPWRIAG